MVTCRVYHGNISERLFDISWSPNSIRSDIARCVEIIYAAKQKDEIYIQLERVRPRRAEAARGAGLRRVARGFLCAGLDDPALGPAVEPGSHTRARRADDEDTAHVQARAKLFGINIRASWDCQAESFGY